MYGGKSMGKFIGFSNLKENINYLEEKNKFLNNNFDSEEKKYYINDYTVFNYLENTAYFAENFSFGEYAIVLNGTLYNKKELKQTLKENSNFEVDNISCAELILKLYICFNTEIFAKLNGNFSFAIWDGKEKQVILVRDHFGTKPLFYSIVDNTIVFST